MLFPPTSKIKLAGQNTRLRAVWFFRQFFGSAKPLPYTPGITSWKVAIGACQTVVPTCERSLVAV
jgi:hypothetical protein